MKVIIAGSRSINDYEAVRFAVQHFSLKSGYITTIDEVVCGGARGVDLTGKLVAEHLCIPVKMFPADWERYGKRAGIIRNQQMADYADAAIIIWDGISPGTRNMIEEMKKRNKPVQLSEWQVGLGMKQ